MSKKNTRKQSEESITTGEYYLFTLPQTILNAKKEWLSGNRIITDYEKALAMIVFGQMMKTGASINSWWWGSNHDILAPHSRTHENQTVFFRTVPPQQDSEYISPVVEPTASLRKLELTYQNISVQS